MKRLSFRKVSKLIALPILLFFVISGNGKFDWNKVISKIEKILDYIAELRSNMSFL